LSDIKDPTKSTGSRIIIELADDAAIETRKEVRPASNPTVIKRWELWLSVGMFALTTAVQQNVVPEGKWTRVAMWGVSVLAQIGIVFGRPLLIRGSRQNIQHVEK
jgi:hypothetical protein